MADVNAQVALGVNPPDPQGGLSTLSKIMSLGQQGLAIRGQQSENVMRAAQATEAQQNAKEKMAGAQLLSDPVGNGLVDNDGNPTPGAQKAIMAAMPTTGAQHYEGILKGATAKVQFNGAINDLRTSERAELASTAGGVAARADGPGDITTALDNLVASKQGTPEYGNYQTIAGTMKTAINHLAETSKGSNPKTPGQEPWRQGALKMASSILPPASTVGPQGLATPQGAQVDTGGQVQPGTTAPALQGGAFRPAGAPVQKTLAPQVISQPITQAPAQVGGAAGTVPRPIEPAGAQPRNPWQPGPGQAQNVTGMATDDAGRYAQVSQEGTNAQTGAQLADQVSQLAEQVRTGKLSKEWTDRLAVLKQHDPELTARQMLSKYAAQLKTLATSSATTDQSRTQIDEGMPSPENMGPDAVKQAAQYVGGVFRMRGARQALADQYAKTNGNTVGIRGADDAFMSAADPTIFAYKALPPGPERQEFLKAHGLTTAEKIQAFRERQNQVNHFSGGQ
jgi:hypothetical protein